MAIGLRFVIFYRRKIRSLTSLLIRQKYKVWGKLIRKWELLEAIPGNSFRGSTGFTAEKENSVKDIKKNFLIWQPVS